MEKAHHKLNSVKLLSCANNEPETAVTDIRTKLCLEPTNVSNRRKREIIIHSCKKPISFLLSKKKKNAKEKSVEGKIAPV